MDWEDYVDWNDYSEDEVGALADAYYESLEEDGSMHVLQAPVDAQLYVRYMVDQAIEDGVDLDEAMAAKDSRLCDLGDLEASYGLSADEDESW